MSEAAGQRLQKALAHLGLASRREVETWIRAGRLTVNGQPATLGMRVLSADKVRLDGRLVRQRVGSAIKVFAVHRSPGVEMRELLQKLPRSGGRRFVTVSPMPAIDGGLELVSSDGETAERLQRGVRRLSADFSVRVHGELSLEGVERVLQGRLDNGTTWLCKVVMRVVVRAATAGTTWLRSVPVARISGNCLNARAPSSVGYCAPVWAR
ncbi:MAG: S4 domain-containing protein [Steroidobacteraceae bacterium]